MGSFFSSLPAETPPLCLLVSMLNTECSLRRVQVFTCTQGLNKMCRSCKEKDSHKRVKCCICSFHLIIKVEGKWACSGQKSEMVPTKCSVVLMPDILWRCGQAAGSVGAYLLKTSSRRSPEVEEMI